jgi:DNA-binding transcriptional LysR family regulator
MELHHLRSVVAIADHGSFTDAAVALHVSQPALSHAVARLEHELGLRLFDRSSRVVRLTAAGKAFLGPARRALAEVSSSRAAAEAVAGVLSGELSVVGVRTAVIETAHLVVEFHRRHPGVHLLIEEPTGDRGATDAVRSGRCDIGVIHSTEKPTDLVGVPAGSQNIVAIFAESLAPRTRTVTVEFLSTVPLIAPVPGTRARAAYDGLFRNFARRPLIAAECSNHTTLFELVRGGLGATLTSDSRAATVNVDGIAIRHIRPQLSPELIAVRRPEASPSANAFTGMLLSRRV